MPRDRASCSSTARDVSAPDSPDMEEPRGRRGEALDAAGLHNPHVRDYVKHWAAHTGAARIEVVSASVDARLIQESLAAGEIQPAGDGLYYSRSYAKDTARSEERTIVATSRPEDQGTYNNWRHSDEIRPVVEGHMKDAMAGKTMYVIPYPWRPRSPLEAWPPASS